jgi:flagellar basal-body rod modification protein FlgD
MSVLSQLANSATSTISQLTSGLTGTSSTASTVPTTSGSPSSTNSQAAGAAGSQQLAGNFNTFLTLLTTQLKNQNPLDPLDTNQFTEQLVQFASVEQQVNMNSNLQTLISMQQTSEATSALQFLGTTVTVSGNTANLANATNNPATWTVSSPSPANANVTITNSAGQTAFTGTLALSAGNQTFSWKGTGANGVTWPDGTYTMQISATGANGQPVTVSTQVQGVVSGINLSQNPPLLTVGGQNVPISGITSISR